jgi:hypothetical protein
MADGEVAAAASGVFALGGTVAVTRLGFGAMQITGPGVWGEPADRGRDQPPPARWRTWRRTSTPPRSS